MEPAGYQRENPHSVTSSPSAGSCRNGARQRLAGGLQVIDPFADHVVLTVMEPAIDEREHPNFLDTLWLLLRAATEPTIDRREHCLAPTFSRPGRCRNGAAVQAERTGSVPLPLHMAAVAAMEPAGDRRDHVHSGPPPDRFRTVRSVFLAASWASLLSCQEAGCACRRVAGVSRLPLLRWVRGRLGISGEGCAVARRRRRRRCRVPASLCGGRLEPGRRA